jgi:hypothetical protein
VKFHEIRVPGSQGSRVRVKEKQMAPVAKVSRVTEIAGPGVKGKDSSEA